MIALRQELRENATMQGDDDNLQKSRKLLQDISNGLSPELEARSLGGLEIEKVQKGLIRCKFLIPKHLSDKDGYWHAGAIAVLIDDVGAAAIISAVGSIKVSVSFNISYFSTAKIQDKVEIEGEVIGHKDMLTLVVVRVRKKDSGEMVAFGKQWTSSTRGSSKL